VLAETEEVEPRILATGTHLVAEWGGTLAELEADGIAPIETVECFAGTTAEASATSIGMAAEGFGASFARNRPDLLLVVGDRIELLGIVGAALPFLIPVAHVSGGDITGGAIDDLVRDAVTKLSHLHFVAMPEHAARLRAIGEEPWRVTVTGEPALDEIRGPWLDLDELGEALGVRLERPVAAVGFHPATLSTDDPAEEAQAMLSALARFPGTVIFTYPGAEPRADEIINLIQAFVSEHPRSVLRASVGQRRYYSLLAHADVLIGNTSSGIWEAPSFELPFVNIGARQQGRVRADNVIDAPAEAQAIGIALTEALTPSFRRTLRGLVNPYGDGHASERIVAVLRDIELDHRLIAKRG
jgi:UDP-hydrolysing UDP-N-acetyl-D-glucosamine 2-epimerase